MSKEEDIGQLNLLGIFHYIFAGFATFVACIASFLWGMIMLSGRDIFPTEYDGVTLATHLFIGGFTVAAWILAILLFVSGRRLRQRKGRMISMCIAGIECVMIVSASMRMGVGVKIFLVLLFVLGVFTLITLNKNSVKELYKKSV